MDLVNKIYAAWVGNAPLVLVTSGLLFAVGILAFGLRGGFAVNEAVGNVVVWGDLAFGLLIAALILLVYLGWHFDGQPGRTITIAVPAVLLGGIVNALFNRAGWLPIWGGLLLVTFTAAGYAAWRVQARFAVIMIVLVVYGMVVTAVLFAGSGLSPSAPIVLGVVAVGGYTLSLACYVLDHVRDIIKTARRETYTQTVIDGLLQTLRAALLWAMALVLIAMPPVLMGTGPIRSLGLLMLIGTFVGTYTALVLPAPLLLTWRGHHETDERDRSGRRDTVRRR